MFGILVADMRRSPEIEALVRRYLAARANGDLATLDNLHSRAEGVRSIGSDGHEWYQGHDDVVGIQMAHRQEKPGVDSDLLRLEAFENGETGWAAVELDQTLPDGLAYRYRLTIVLEMEAGAWKFVQIHFSVPVANKEVGGVELTRTLSDLLTSIDSDTESTAMKQSILGTATVVFTDIVDSTALSQSMGDGAWSDLINDHFSSVASIVEREGGSVVKTLGDGGMFVFSSGASALSAAVGIQRRVAESADKGVQLRVGVHTGDVVQSHDDYIGLTVNKAARVAAAADGGQILVSATTVGLVNATEYGFGVPITVELKGIEGTHVLQPLLWS
jgi:class 3 adenylate cyclase